MLPSSECDRFATWHAVLEIARRAPSPHNVQPWRVQLLTDRAADLFIDGARTLPMEDTTGSFLLSAMGMFTEAIRLAGAANGLALAEHPHDDPADLAAMVARPARPGLIPFARLDLRPDLDARPEYDPALFAARRTSRIPLRRDAVPAAAAARLASLGAEWRHRCSVLSDPALIADALEHNIDAVFHDLNDAGYHDEIAGWFRWTRDHAERTRDGLDWRCMNLSRPELWLSARAPGLLRVPALRALFRRRYRRQLGHAPALGVLAGDFFDPRKAVHAGRFLLRFWLELARLGLSMHPLGNLVTNRRAASWFADRTGIADAWLIFKLGVSDPAPLSHRRDIDDILVAPGAIA